MEKVDYNIPKDLADKIASMSENQHMQELVNKTNKIVAENELRINLKEVEINILGRCTIGRL